MVKSGESQARVVSITKRVPVSFAPELKKFLDDCIVPVLVRAAMKEILEKPLESSARPVADCVHGTTQSAGAHQ